MSKNRETQLKTEAAAAAKAAREIAEKADNAGREMTEAERAEFDQKMALAIEKRDAAKTAKADAEVLAEAVEIAGLIGDGAVGDVELQGTDEIRKLDPQHSRGKALGSQVIQSKAFKEMLDRFRGTDGSVRVPDKARIQSDAIPFDSLIGHKALFTGGSQTSGGAFITPDRTDIIELLGRRPLTIRDLISVRQTESDTVEYVEQTSHTNAAAPVAEATSSASPTTGASSGAALTLDPNGGYKPEGAWAFVERSTSVRTIAEWVPATKRSLADAKQLEGLINDELVADLKEAEETQILTGNGTGQNLQGILGWSGIQTMAATTTNDATWFASFRSAKRLARVNGRVNPNAIVVNPLQAERIDVSKDTQNRFYGNGPFGLGPTTLWGLPVIESEAITAGTALLGDFSKAVLWDREQAAITMTDSHADFFIRNLIAILAEERVAFAVTRPQAFVTVTGL